MARQMLDRLVDEESRLLPRPFLADKRDEGRLAGMGIAPRRLAGCRLVAAMVDAVVSDREGEADLARIAAIGPPRVGRHLDHDARRYVNIFDQRAGPELLEVRDRGKVEFLS